MKIVLVDWEDATTLDYSTSAEAVKEHEGIKASTVGFLIDEGKEYVKVAMITFENPDVPKNSKYFNHKYIQIIPRSLVKKMTVLAEVFE